MTWLDPPLAFADQLRQALEQEITAAQMALRTSSYDLLADGFRELWEADVFQAFFSRYRLHGQ